MVKKEYRKGENGSTLVTVLIIFSLLCVIGVALLGMINTSQAFVAKDRKNTKDRNAAENAINEAIAQIESKLEHLHVKGLSPYNALERIDNLLNSIQSLSEYKYTVTHKTIREGREDGIIVKEVTIESDIGDSGKKLTHKLTLSTISEIFQYSLFTP